MVLKTKEIFYCFSTLVRQCSHTWSSIWTAQNTARPNTNKFEKKGGQIAYFETIEFSHLYIIATVLYWKFTSSKAK